MEKEPEKMILSHEPVAGYRTALFIVLAVGILYLAVVFGRALF